MYKWALLRKDHHILSCLIDCATDKTIELYLDPADDETAVSSASSSLRVGDIVTARIDRIMHGLDAAFVDLPGGEKGYIPLKELDGSFFTKRNSPAKFCQGDELLAQVRQEAIKGKAITVTGELSVTDTLLVVGIRSAGGASRSEEADPQNEPKLRLSKKLSPQARGELRAFMEALLAGKGDPAQAGDPARFAETVGALSQEGEVWILLRTAAFEALQSGHAGELERQLLSAAGSLLEIIERGPYLSFGKVHYREQAPYLKRIRSFSPDMIEKIITDDEALYRALETAQLPRLEFYRDSFVSLHNLYRMTFRLEEATSKYVHLKSGGTLVIEHTEALNVIDVNTAKSSGGGKRTDREAALLKTNLEAAAEAARHIRLRNLSGIILIDFINLAEKEHERLVLDTLRELLARDPVETKCVDMTRLGLAEITRKKVERPLHEVPGITFFLQIM